MTAIVRDRTAIYSCAIVQGAAVAVFFAYTGVLISAYHYGLTLRQYGALFLPQVIAAIVATLFAARIGAWLRAQRAYLAGLSCSLLGMALLLATERVPRLAASYPLLLTATALVGTGFGLAFPFLRSYAVSLRPLRARRQVILVDALVAAGMAAAPGYALLTRGTGAWWSLALLLGLLIIGEMVLGRSLRAPPDGAPVLTAGRRFPASFRAYLVLALLYGVCAVIGITAAQHVSGSVPNARLSFLTVAEAGFWAALVAGSRVAFGVIDGMRSRQRAASMGVFMIALVVLALSFAVARYDLMYIGIYLLAGIGCAALLPVDTRPGNEHIAAFPFAVTVGIMALFPVGVGLSRSGYGFAVRNGMSPPEIFFGLAVLGAAAGLLLFPIILGWRTMAYFEHPAFRNAQARRAGHHGGGSAAPAPAPRQAPDRSADDSGHAGRGGATAAPDRPQRDSGSPG